MCEGRKVWHLLPLTCFYHERHHGLTFHCLRKLDLLVLPQSTEVIDDCDIDEDMVLMRKEVLEIFRKFSAWRI